MRKNDSKYPLKELGELLRENPQYGANERAIEGNPETDLRYVRITDINKFGNLNDDDWKTAEHTDKKYLLEENDILFARSGATAGKCYLHKNENGKAIYAGYLIRFRLDTTKANPRYIFYYTQTERYGRWVKSIQRPSGQPNINSQEFKSLRIPVPPLETQNRIVEMMDKAYLEKKANEKEAEKQLLSLDTYLFETLGIIIPESNNKNIYLVNSSTVERRLDPEAYHPERQTVVKLIQQMDNHLLNELVSFRRTLVSSRDDNLPYVGLENIESGTGFYSPSEEAVTQFNCAFQFHKGDILFPKLRPYLNKVFYATFDGYCSTEFHVLKATRINPKFLVAVLKSKLTLAQTCHLMTGNTLPRLQTEDIEELPIPTPDNKVQEQIAIKNDKVTENVLALRAEAISCLEEAKGKIEMIILGN